MNNVKWYNLNKEGYIINEHNKIIWPLPEKGGIYIYTFLLDNKKFYIGSTKNIRQRFRQHKYRAERELIYNSLLYSYVTKYGWNNFKYGILENIDLNRDSDLKVKRRTILDLEQKYLDLFTPSLNINKFAGSMRGFKHNENTKKNYSVVRTGKCYRKIEGVIVRPEVSQETILKLKLHSKEIKVIIYTAEYKPLKEFNSIREAANYVELSPSSVSKYIKSGRLWNNMYYFKLNTIMASNNISFPLEDYDDKSATKVENTITPNKRSYIFEVLKDNKVIFKFKSVTKASAYLNISRRTLTSYSRNDKLWRDKFRFRITCPSKKLNM